MRDLALRFSLLQLEVLVCQLGHQLAFLDVIAGTNVGLLEVAIGRRREHALDRAFQPRRRADPIIGCDESGAQQTGPRLRPPPAFTARCPGPNSGATASDSAPASFAGQGLSTVRLIASKGPSSAAMFSQSVRSARPIGVALLRSKRDGTAGLARFDQWNGADPSRAMTLRQVGVRTVHSWLGAFGQRIDQGRALPDRLFHGSTDVAQQALVGAKLRGMRQRFDLDVTTTRQTDADALTSKPDRQLRCECGGGLGETLVGLYRRQQLQDPRGVRCGQFDGSFVDCVAQRRERRLSCTRGWSCDRGSCDCARTRLRSGRVDRIRRVHREWAACASCPAAQSLRYRLRECPRSPMDLASGS